MKNFIDQLFIFNYSKYDFLIIIYYIDIYSLFGGFQEYYINPEVVNNRSWVTSNTYLITEKMKNLMPLFLVAQGQVLSDA